jgi:hypothetical protein
VFKSLDIRSASGWIGWNVGIVDYKEGDGRIMLTKDDPKAGGRHHLISIDWVGYVDRKVHLNKPSQMAFQLRSATERDRLSDGYCQRWSPPRGRQVVARLNADQRRDPRHLGGDRPSVRP